MKTLKTRTITSITVGWDSEYQSQGGWTENVQLTFNLTGEHLPHGDWTPISDQLHVLDDGRNIFLDHVGERITLRSIIDHLAVDYPDLGHITLVTHFGRAELSAVSDGLDWLMAQKDAEGDLQGSALIVQKTVIGQWTYKPPPLLVGGERTIVVDLWDTFLLNAPGSLEKLGDLIGLEKLPSLGYRESDTMLSWWNTDPESFTQYACRDAEVTAKYFQAYCTKLTDAGLEPRKTIGSIYEHAASDAIERDMEGLHYQKKKAFNGKYYQKRLMPTKQAEQFATSYYGGRNESYLHGRFNGDVFDYDLVGAYSGVLGMLPNWSKTGKVFTDAAKLYESATTDPLANGRVSITYKFKDDVLHPSLPVHVDNGIVFPQAAQTEITLQEYMVAYPYLESCSVIAVVFASEGESPLVELSSDLKERRRKAKESGDILSDSIWKLVLNAGYGKFSQAVTERDSIDLANSTRERVVRTKIPRSKITQPMIAAYITGWCRSMIAEYLFYCQEQGISVSYLATDGFSTVGDPLPNESMNGVGILSRIIAARYESPVMELKHQGVDQLVLKTRGTAMLDGDNPLVAMTGVQRRGKTNQDVAKFMLSEWASLEPLKETRYEQSNLPTITDWIINNTPPKSTTTYKSYNYDYDLKRRPSNPREVDGRLQFDTVPWKDVYEYTEWRDAYQNFRRGTRKGVGSDRRQIGTKNKITTLEDLHRFEDYVTTRAAGMTSMAYNVDRTYLRVAANVAHQLGTLGFKKIAEKLNVPAQTVRYWTLKEPMTTYDLQNPAVERLLESRVSNVNSKGNYTRTIDTLDSVKVFLREILALWRSNYAAHKAVDAVANGLNAAIAAPYRPFGGSLDSGSHLTPSLVGSREPSG